MCDVYEVKDSKCYVFSNLPKQLEQQDQHKEIDRLVKRMAFDCVQRNVLLQLSVLGGPF
jgi:hypothetical protein